LAGKFAAKISQTVEATVKISRSRADGVVQASRRIRSAVKAETDGDIHITLSDATGDKLGIAFEQLQRMLRFGWHSRTKKTFGPEEKRSLAWQRQRCAHVKHFTRPVLAEVAAWCPKCRIDVFGPILHQRLQ